MSLSDLLREMFKKQHPGEEATRSKMQDYGNMVRSKFGSNYLSKRAIDIIKKDDPQKKWVVDSIRNPAEIKELRLAFRNIYVLGIYANQDVRWERSKQDYNNNYGLFLEDEARDRGENFEYGQNVTECFLNSDLVISNNETIYPRSDNYNFMESKVREYVNILENPFTRKPKEEESLMAAAYVNGLRSSCLKRNVGAVIVDDWGNIFSSGYNEVPHFSRTCLQEYGECYRDKFKYGLQSMLGDKIREDTFKEIWSHIKNLERCKALHAEENAILNVVRFGSAVALQGATLYTTTFPCNLCANKIAVSGIKKVIYFEPYPQKEAVDTLRKHSVEIQSFEGITFRAYFRVYGGVV